GSETHTHSNLFMNKRNWLLTINTKPSLLKLVSHDRLINRLQQTRSVGRVNLEGHIDDLFCNLVLRHWEPFSRKDAKTQRCAKKTQNPSGCKGRGAVPSKNQLAP